MKTKIYDWNNIKDEFHNASLLIGNGFSRAVSTGFGYRALYKIALELDEACGGLTSDDKLLFEALGNGNSLPTFEQVLNSLYVADKVCGALGYTRSEIQARYESIRKALGFAVKLAHVEWEETYTGGQNKIINGVLREYRTVYSTNYDLLVYWSMAHDFSHFFDFFSGKSNRRYVGFERSRQIGVPRRSKTSVLFLHGGLHLFGIADQATTVKKVRQGESLLDSFPEPPIKTAQPLVVTEGTSDQKMAAISGNDYLSFAYDQFFEDEAPLVVFGHRLASEDSHIANAITATDREGGEDKRPVAISIHQKNEETIRHYLRLFKGSHTNIRFYDAVTHPLGAKELCVD